MLCVTDRRPDEQTDGSIDRRTDLRHSSGLTNGKLNQLSHKGFTTKREAKHWKESREESGRIADKVSAENEFKGKSTRREPFKARKRLGCNR